MEKKLNRISDPECDISHRLPASCCDCVSVLIIGISDVKPTSTALSTLITN